MHPSRRFSRSSRWLAPLVLTIFAFTPMPAQADFMFTASGTNGSDGTVSAEGYFVLGNNTITLYLANLDNPTNNQGQGISGVKFSVSGLSSNISVSSVSGDVVTLKNGGSFSSPVYETFNSSSSPPYADWAFTNSTNPTVMTDVGNSLTSHPHYMILGPNAQFSGNGGKNFNPYFESQATSEFTSPPTQGDAVVFVLNAPGVTSSSTISGVRFYFGTGPDTSVSGTSSVPGTPPGSPPPAVPAPPSVVLLGIGLGVLLARACLARSWRGLSATAA